MRGCCRKQKLEAERGGEGCIRGAVWRECERGGRSEREGAGERDF